ncbi:raffinose/stachyose/melibiose transport system permease protein [Caldalkalibacillus uzonensis]|uniref:Raffinose/stachyose/melibiose transport system permease protein n=1 Tax=Caldalkalibacillus uzonensis TaxID=353224 RepID=A0ABU0CQ51_9BACI|nr:carbohydrate ABC transporter permease [Caldalkalibacillus uzonensis]MDQ0338544.1 raffinose/stachyose/melibiose transport system permease protein [Caldalkalibacillus uzonensis]
MQHKTSTVVKPDSNALLKTHPLKQKRKGIILFLLSSILFVLYIFPFALVVLNSFKERLDIVQNPFSLPEQFSLENYIWAYQTMNFPAAFINSLIITVFSVVIIIVFSSMLAYFLVRWKWRMNHFILFMLVASMIIPFQALMIPFVSVYGNLGLLNSKWTLIFCYLGFGVSLATFMYHGFIKNIPKELEEAAYIDGASKLQVFWYVVFPLLKPITITIAILDVLWIWNDFLLPSLVLIDESNRTIPLSTFYFFGHYTSEYGAAMAALVLAIIPVIIFYLLMQKQIIKGVLEGSIK